MMAMVMRRIERVPFQTMARLKMRIEWQPEPARVVMHAAIDRATQEKNLAAGEPVARAATRGPRGRRPPG